MAVPVELAIENLREHDHEFECRCSSCNGYIRRLAEWFGLLDGAPASQVYRHCHAEGLV